MKAVRWLGDFGLTCENETEKKARSSEVVGGVDQNIQYTQTIEEVLYILFQFKILCKKKKTHVSWCEPWDQSPAGIKCLDPIMILLYVREV